MQYLFKIVQIFALSLGLLSFSSCQKKNKASFIIIAVDRLSFNAFSCGDEKFENTTGLNTFCQESIRYTNVYTTSTQPAAAIGSLLTGVYPYQHRLHRSFDRINPHYPLISEYFKKNNYRTSYFGSSPAVLKKTGLSRGFDLFDDVSFLSQSNYFINFDQQVDLFKTWVEDSHESFFSIIHTSDLDVLSEENTTQTKLELFDERLGKFIQYLKKNNLWEKNYVVILGLQGRSEYGRPNETHFSNLHSENVNVAFFIKPPRQKGDEGVSLKIDTPSTLADLGLSFIKLIEPLHPYKQNETFPLLDYSMLWSQNQLNSLNLNSPRKILLEASNTWRRSPELRFSLVQGNFIYLEAEQNQLFNKLNDGLETIEISKNNPDIANDSFHSLNLIHQLTNTPVWTQFENEHTNFVKLNKLYWTHSSQRELVFENEKLRLKNENSTNPLSTLLIYFNNEKKVKDLTYDEARRHSYNLANENMWGLWNQNKIWAHPGVTTENQ